MVYLPFNLPYKSTIHVGKYASPMDPMGYDIITMKVFGSLCLLRWFATFCIPSSWFRTYVNQLIFGKYLTLLLTFLI